MEHSRYRKTFRLLGGRDARRRHDIDEELALHLEMRVRQLVARGLTPDEARAEAARRFGDLDSARRELARIDHRKEASVKARDWFDGVMHDLRFALRSLARSPGFTAVVVLTLALGIGANAAVFGIVDRLLLRGPEHVRDPEQLARLYITYRTPSGHPLTESTLGYASYLAVREHARTLEGVAAYSRSEAVLGRGADASEIWVGQVTADFFPLLGVQPHLGRFFDAEEDRPNAAQHVVVLGHGLWRRAFGGDPGVLGRTVVIRDETWTVVGVAPPGFTGVEPFVVDAWTPMSLRGASTTTDWTTTWSAQWLQIVGRLRPGATSEQVAEDLTLVHRAAYTENDEALAEASMSVAPLRHDRAARERGEDAVSRWLIGVSLVVLLIACANVANLLLARAVRRRREVAVRLALGIGRRRLIRLLLAESTLLALGGALAGLALAWWGGQLMRSTLLPEFAWSGAPVDGRVLIFTAIAALGTAILIGLVPALQASRPDLVEALRSGTREGGGRRARLRTTLTVVQVSLSVVLLVGAGLFVRSLWNVRTMELGFDLERVVAVSIALPRLASFSDEDLARARAVRSAVYERALERVRAMPGVERASIAVGTPFQSRFQTRLHVPGWDSLPRLAGGGPYVSAVTSDYFETMGTPLLRGRTFLPTEGAGSERVAIINETMARTLWPDRDPLGACIRMHGEECSRVVGIVADTRRTALREEPAMQYWIPSGQERGFGGSLLLVRASGDPRPLLTALPRELAGIDPAIRFVDAWRMQDEIDSRARQWQLGATMFGVFGLLALLVAAVGLYSVIAYGVSQRLHELGVRVALGARGGTIARMVVRQAVVATAVGIGVGVVLALAAGGFIEALLFDTSPRHPLAFVGVALVLLVVSVAASLLPARRAMRVDPVVALRAE